MDAGLPFRSDLAAFVPGVGFRVVVVGDCQCAIDDRPAAGKGGDLVGPRPGDCPRAPGLVPALFSFWPVAAGAACAFGDWFTAERGTGPGQNGWV